MYGKLRRVYWAVEALFLALRGRSLPRDRAPQKWLILGYAAIGDMVFLLPLLEALRRQYPEAHITFLCRSNPTTTELVPATGLVDEIIAPAQEWEFVSAAERAGLTRKLNDAGYDAILLSLSSPAHFFQRALVRIPIRVGHCRELIPPPHLKGLAALAWKLKHGVITGEFSRRLLLTHKTWIRPDWEHSVKRNMRLLESLGIAFDSTPPRPKIPLPPSAREKVKNMLGARTRAKRVGIHLGIMNNPYFKIWPSERFGRLCRLLEDAGQVECFFLGGAEESSSVTAARQAAGREIPSLVGRCSLLESFAAIEQCDLLISNDTGMAKAAMALGIATATIWGPTEPAELGILWEAEKHLEIKTGIFCQPCVFAGMAYARAAIDYANCGNHDCLAQMTVETVFSALRRKYPFLSRP